MITADRQTLLFRTGWIVLAGTLIALFSLALEYRNMPVQTLLTSSEPQISNPTTSWKTPASFSHAKWTQFKTYDSAGAERNLGLAARFRLAGTFFNQDGAGNESRMALIEDLSISRQSIVCENEEIDENLLIVNILTDRIIIKGPSGEENLWLSYAGASNGARTGELVSDEYDDSIKGTRFGKKTGKENWAFARKALLDYYNELMENPERLLKVFDSMKPVYTKDRAIEGYQLAVQGEGDFFQAIGIAEGDIIRRVNSMEMTNRNRCEYLIGQFVQNRANAFVVDLERNGKRVRQTYVIR